MNATTHFGLVKGMPANEYHASPGVSNSMLSDLKRSPAHCWALHHAPDRPRREATPSMAAGTLAHALILEPEEMSRRYAVRPEGFDSRTKECKEWAARAVAEGLEIISAEQMAAAEAQRAAVLGVPELAALLARGEPEVSCFWRDAGTGLECRMRADWVHPLADGRVILLDLKTTQDASPDEFGRTVWKYGYHRQGAHYTQGFQHASGTEVAAFVLAAVTSSYPFIAVPYMLADEDMGRGESEIRELLDLYAECQRTGSWPAYGSGIQIINRPAWVK